MPNNNDAKDDMEDMLPLNGLRGVCAMAIFLGHQTEMFLAPPWRDQTVIVGLEYLQAVSLFFLLSGIPLARLYSTTKKVHDWEGTMNFWRKRFSRLAPMYYLTLVLNLAVIFVICENVDLLGTLKSFFGCAFLLQSIFVSLIHVGGVLWQVALFVFSYALFPFLSRKILGWEISALRGGIIGCWLFSAGLWCLVFVVYPPVFREWGFWLWHVHWMSRLPHAIAGVLLGEIVERKRNDPNRKPSDWAVVADALSLVLLVTALQAPIVQTKFGTSMRSEISIGLQALLLPIHALWLASVVLAYSPQRSGDMSPREVDQGGGGRKCWTRRALSLKPLVALGDVSLVLYCLHLVVLFLYTSALAYFATGDRRIAPAVDDYTLSVQAPWWHAPVQWALVLAVSFAMSKWFEAPMRKVLAGTGRQPVVGMATGADTEATLLLPPSSGSVEYGRASAH